MHISFVGYIKVRCLLQDAAPLQGDINLEQENVKLYQLKLEKIYHNPCYANQTMKKNTFVVVII
jgi:hypothetical protein